jgi:hypothetical protein
LLAQAPDIVLVSGEWEGENPRYVVRNFFLFKFVTVVVDEPTHKPLKFLTTVAGLV